MDSNFCWQPFCYPVISDFSTTTYLDQFLIPAQQTTLPELTYEELKQKQR